MSEGFPTELAAQHRYDGRKPALFSLNRFSFCQLRTSYFPSARPDTLRQRALDVARHVVAERTALTQAHRRPAPEPSPGRPRLPPDHVHATGLNLAILNTVVAPLDALQVAVSPVVAPR